MDTRAVQSAQRAGVGWLCLGGGLAGFGGGSQGPGDAGEEPRFAARGDPAPVAEVWVLFGDVAFGRDVAGGTLAVTGGEDPLIRAHRLGGELEFDVGFAGQDQELGGAEVEGGQVDLVTGVGALPPVEAEGGEALMKRGRTADEFLFEFGDGEARAVAGFEADAGDAEFGFG